MAFCSNVESSLQQALQLHQQGNWQAAEQYYREILQCHPQHPDGLHLYGVLKLQQGEPKQAEQLIQQAIHFNGNSPLYFNNLGNSLKDQDRLPEAIQAYQTALRINPKHWEAYNDLAVALKAEGHFEQAKTMLRQLVAACPQHFKAHDNLGNVYRELGELDKAIQSHQQAIALAPNYHYAHWNLSLSQLSKGQLQAGWQAHEWRLQRPDFSERYFPVFTGNAKQLAEQSLFIAREQGVGDEILYSSCLNDLIDHQHTVVVECDPRILPLLERSYKQLHFINRYDINKLRLLKQLPASTQQLFQGSLPGLLRPTLETFGKHTKHLICDPELEQHWQQRVAQLGSGLKIGIAWHGQMDNSYKNHFYPKLEDFAPLSTVASAQWINLQYGPATVSSADLQQSLQTELHCFPELDQKNDFENTAALYQCCDVIITPATTVSMLAGALGCRTMMLLPANGHWKKLGTDYFPWFPTLEIFQQQAFDQWQPVILRIAEALKHLQVKAHD